MKKVVFIFISLLFIQCKQTKVAKSQEEAQVSSSEKEMQVSSDEKAVQVAMLYEETTVSEVTEIMNFLASDELEGRDTGSDGLEKAALYIENEFKKNGIDPYFDTYRDNFDVNGTATYNVVGLLKGSDTSLSNEFVIIGAHLDHIGKAAEVAGDTIANGANDNATGVAAVITLAKHFAKSKNNRRSVLFVLFGAEEKGLLGSKHLSKVLKEKNMNLYTVINFEMIGVPPNDKSQKAYLTGYEMSNMATKINEYSKNNLIGFSPKAKEYSLFRRSDNYPFYEAFKIPSQTIFAFDFTNYDYYHHVDDEVSEIDIVFMTGLINDCIKPISEILNTATKEIQLN